MRDPAGNDWTAVSEAPLPVADAVTWATTPGSGAVVSFCGTVRDHSDGRPGVVSLEYETYPEYVEAALDRVAAAARDRWPAIDHVALLHRIGVLDVGDLAVVVVVSTPHRAQAFAAAQFCIDTLKATVPIWKFETWEGGQAWVDGCRAAETPADHPAGEPAR